MYECLAATCQQDYPRDKLTVHICISTRDDAAYQTVKRVVIDFPEHDVRLFIEDEDPMLVEGNAHPRPFGPNPKIRNMSRSYREAKGDIVWILDCNIWVGSGTCGRMVDTLCGFSSNGPKRPYKFVHQLPVAVDVDAATSGIHRNDASIYDSTSSLPARDLDQSNTQHDFIGRAGGRLDELFLTSSHAKMYVAINTVAVAPCICGKSNMFRASHLNALTNTDGSAETRFGTGLDYFSHNICEDHLIGDLLWKSDTPAAVRAITGGLRMRNHGLVYGDIAIQPVAGMSILNYAARRVRWLRVRKFTVPVATLVEPGTESIVCSAMGAWGLTTSDFTKAIFGATWTSYAAWMLSSLAVWALVDRCVYILLMSGATIEDTQGDSKIRSNVPVFAKRLPRAPWQARRSFLPWLMAWVGRELLTLPIWTWAIWGGVTVTWRDAKFWVGLDMKVHPLSSQDTRQSARSNGFVPGNGFVQESTPKNKRS